MVPATTSWSRWNSCSAPAFAGAGSGRAGAQTAIASDPFSWGAGTNAKLRKAVVPVPPVAVAILAQESDGAYLPAGSAKGRMRWAQRRTAREPQKRAIMPVALAPKR